MKKLIILIAILLLITAVVQAQKRTFLRLYSLAGFKFQKGYLAGTTDSSLSIYKGGDTIEVPVVNIGYIKTKRSVGHSMWVGALAVGVPSIVYGAASGEPKVNDNTLGGLIHDATVFTPAEGAVTGAFLGGIIGAATGAIISAIGKSTTFKINGSLDEWRLQKRMVDLLQAGR